MEVMHQWVPGVLKSVTNSFTTATAGVFSRSSVFEIPVSKAQSSHILPYTFHAGQLNIDLLVTD